MSNNILNRVQPILDKYHFTDEEKVILGKAKGQVRYNTFFGAATGSMLGLAIALRRKPPNLFRASLLSAGFGFIGTQVGFILGYSQAVNTIKSLPDQDKIKSLLNDIMREVQNNKKPNKGFDILGPPDFKRRFPSQKDEATPAQSQLETNTNQLADEIDELLSESKKIDHNQSAWDRIRKNSNPSKSKWDEIRSTSPTGPESDEESFDRDVNLAQEQMDNPTNNQGGTIKRNKYGDIIEFNEDA